MQKNAASKSAEEMKREGRLRKTKTTDVAPNSKAHQIDSCQNFTEKQFPDNS